jgi:hypothetical protein
MNCAPRRLKATDSRVGGPCGTISELVARRRLSAAWAFRIAALAPLCYNFVRGLNRAQVRCRSSLRASARRLFSFPRIMVQVQSSWFPLYDRNPQTFVPNIFFATAADYKKATERIYHEAGHASFVELPIVTTER